jgi:hypothetical protein
LVACTRPSKGPSGTKWCRRPIFGCPTRILYLHLPCISPPPSFPREPGRVGAWQEDWGRAREMAPSRRLGAIRRARLGLPLVHIAGGATSAPRRPSHPCRGRSAAPCRIFSTSNSNRTPRTSSEIGISGGGGGLLFVFSVRDWNNQRLWSVAAGPRAGRGGGGGG